MIPTIRKDLALFMDLYELTMAAVYFKSNKETLATFDLFVRTLPKNRSYCVAAGLEDCLEFLENFHFQEDQINYLRSLNLFETNFIDYIANFNFTGDVWAMPEGTVFFPNEPIIRVTAPVIEAQIIESFLLNTINLQSSIATKASRVVLSALPKEVYDFSLRRTQGVDAGIKAARSSYIAGCLGTSNCLSGYRYGIPVFGTMAHSFVMVFDSEITSFRKYCEVFPNKSTLLVDTYDYTKGINNAIDAAKELEKKNFRLKAIRIDSGDLFSVSKLARSSLDAAGLGYVKILASGNLDEYSIAQLLKKKAPIDSFGVGTHMGTSSDAPYLDVIYKLSEVTDSNNVFLPRMKLSTAKITYPGRKQVYRIKDRRGMISYDMIGLDEERSPGQALLVKIMEKGKTVYQKPTMAMIREYAKENLSSLPEKFKNIYRTQIFPIKISKGLKRLKKTFLKNIKKSR